MGPARHRRVECPLTEMADAGRAENQAAARRLTAVGRLFELRRAQRGEEADWAVDTWAAVGPRSPQRCESAWAGRAAT